MREIYNSSNMIVVIVLVVAAVVVAVLLGGGGGGGGSSAVERATPGEEVPGSIPAVAARSLQVGSVSV